MRLSETQRQALSSVKTWGTGGTYMPGDGTWRTFRALQRKGLVRYRAWGALGVGSPAGFELTEEGKAALE